MEERLRDAGEAERDEDVSAPKAGLGGGRGHGWKLEQKLFVLWEHKRLI